MAGVTNAAPSKTTTRQPRIGTTDKGTIPSARGSSTTSKGTPMESGMRVRGVDTPACWAMIWAYLTRSVLFEELCRWMEKSVGRCKVFYQSRKQRADCGGRTLAGHDTLSVNLSYVSQGSLARSKPSHKSPVCGAAFSPGVVSSTQLIPLLSEPRVAWGFVGLQRVIELHMLTAWNSNVQVADHAVGKPKIDYFSIARNERGECESDEDTILGQRGCHKHSWKKLKRSLPSEIDLCIDDRQLW